MKFDKSKFKRTTLDEVEAEVKQAEKTMFKNRTNYVEFASIEKGKNVFRVMPSPTGKVYIACKMAKLKCKVASYDATGKLTGYEVKDKNVFCADVHGKEILKGKDPIVLYCDYVRKKAAEEFQDDDERKKYLNPINGYRKGKTFVWGLNPNLVFICYVYRGPKDFARLQLYSSWMNRIKEISVELSDDDTVSFDVFSSIEESYPLVIMQGEDDKGKRSYSISAGQPKKGQSWDEFWEETRIPDEDLEYFLNEVPPLEELYKEVYSIKDFNLAMDGLKRFDEENNYGIFEDDAFLSELEEMAACLPEEGNEEGDEKDDEEEAPKSSKKTAAKSKKAPVEEEDDDEEEEEKEEAAKPEKPKSGKPISAPASKKAAAVTKNPPLSKMKKFLGEYIAEEYPGMELPDDLSLSEIRSWYELAEAGEALPFPEEDEEEETVDAEDETETADENIPEDADYDDKQLHEDGEAEAESNEESPVDESKVSKDGKLSAAKARLEAIKAKMKKK